MATFHSCGLTAAELADCAIFKDPTVLHNAAGQPINPKSDDPYMQKIHDKIQSSVAAKLRRDQYRLQPAKMILGRAAVMKQKSANIIEDVLAYKTSLLRPPHSYSNDDINKLVKSRY